MLRYWIEEKTGDNLQKEGEIGQQSVKDGKEDGDMGKRGRLKKKKKRKGNEKKNE